MTFMERSCLFRIHRTEPELRHRRLVRQHVFLTSAGPGAPRRFVPITATAAISSAPASGACKPASPACRSTKTKAGTSCTWASLAVGATARPPRRAAWTRSACGPGPNCATTIRPVPVPRPQAQSPTTSCRTPTFPAWSIRAAITCNDDYLLGLEMLYIRGPASLQAEYGWNFVNAIAPSGAQGPADSPITCSTADTSKWRTR